MVNVSIVVCTYNRCEILKYCLDSLEKQSVDRSRYEVIVVDNNSTDNTKQVVEEYCDRNPNFRYVFEENQGLSHARNRGVKEANGEWVGYVDDDGYVENNYVKLALETIENYDFDCFGGVVKNWFKHEKPKWYPEDYEVSYLRTLKTSEIDGFICGGISFFKSEIIYIYGGFDESLGMKGSQMRLGEETKLQVKMKEDGKKIGLNPEIVLNHLVSNEKMSVKYMLKRKYQNGLHSKQIFSRTETLSLFRVVKVLFGNILRNSPKLFKRDYYLENFVLDVLSKPLYLFGVYRSRPESLVSVLMPVYNSEKFLSESIKSILSQTFENFEFLILDDGSTDRSLKIVQKFSEQDGRIKVFKNEKNLGVVESRNKLINLSTGKYIAWIDSDDIAMPQRLEKQAKFLNAFPDIGMVGADLIRIDEDGNEKCIWKYESDPQKLQVELFFHCPFSTVVMIRREALPASLYNPAFPVAEDYDLYCRIAEKWNVENVPQPLLKCRNNLASISTVNKTSMKELSVRVIFEHAKRLKINLNKEIIEDMRLIIEARRISDIGVRKVENSLIELKKCLSDSFDENVLDSVVQKYWFETCRKASHNGVKIMKTFFNSQLYCNSLTLKDRMRLIFRCLIRV